MSEPRPHKAAVVAEVRDRLSASDAAVLTEYRGLNVPDMAALRRSLRSVGAEYTVYKNTMVRLAADELGLELGSLLTGPTAIAFLDGGGDGPAGDAAAVAKALRDFSRVNRALVVKGGLLGQRVLSAEQVVALAALPPRDVLLAQFAGALGAPLSKFAGLLEAVPRSFAHGLKALINAREAAIPAESSGAGEAAVPGGSSGAGEATNPKTNQSDTSDTQEA